MITVGFDTSNYTTSVASFDGTKLVNCSRLLKVRPGQLGLRQSDALFSHVQALPELLEQLGPVSEPVKAVGVSTRPRAVEGSYMPCFLAGVCAASAFSTASGAPLVPVSHQQGHLAAVLCASGHTELLDQPFLAWHLSGGTTELLFVDGSSGPISCRIIGGTSDISAGQLIDRTGQMLGFPFPSGKAIDCAAAASDEQDFFRIRQNGFSFSVSGMENKMREYFRATESRERTAAFVLNSLFHIIFRVTEAAVNEYHGLPVVFSGGVSSNSLLRKKMSSFQAVFSEPEYSTDNAAGTAFLAWYLKEYGL